MVAIPGRIAGRYSAAEAVDAGELRSTLRMRRFFAKASARTRRTRRITGLKISTRENAARAVAHLGATY